MSRNILAVLFVSVSVHLFIPQSVLSEVTYPKTISDEKTKLEDLGDAFTTEGAENPDQNFVNAVQTTWDGGPGTPGPVNDFGNRFHTQTDMDFSHNGYITNSGSERFVYEGKYLMATRVGYTAIADFGGDSDHFDYFVAFENAHYQGPGQYSVFNILGHDNTSNYYIGTISIDAPIGPIAIADYNDDNRNDFVIAVPGIINQRLKYYKNQGGFDFDPNIALFGDLDLVKDIAAGEFMNRTEDAIAIMASDAISGTVELYEYHPGVDNFSHLKTAADLNTAGPLAVGNFNGDYSDDFVCGSQGNAGLKWYENNKVIGNPSFIEHTIRNNGDIYDVCIGDFDYDNDPDIAAILSDGAVDALVWWNNTDGLGGFSSSYSLISDAYEFTSQSRIACAPSVSGRASDIVLTINKGSDSQYDVVYFENDGDGNFVNEFLIATGDDFPEPVSVSLGDFNGDGTNDVVVSSADYTGAGNGSVGAYLQDITPFNDAELISSVYNTYQGGDETIYGGIFYTLSSESNPDYCEVYCRGSHNADMSGSTWQGPLENDEYLGNYQGFYNEEQYVQYRIVLNAPSATEPPVSFQEISIEYDPSGSPGVPRISHTSPAHEDSDVVLNSNVIIYFTEPMDENTLNTNNIVLRQATNDLPWTGAYEEGSEEYVFTLDPANNFSPNATIFLEISPSVLGADGTPLDTDGDGQPGGDLFQIWFYTGTNIDNVPPTISEVTATPNPIGGASEVIITALYSDTGDPGNANIVGGSCYIAEPYTEFEVIPSDGAFDEPTENVSVTIPVGSLPQGDSIDVNITARDSAANESAPEVITLIRGAAKFLDKKTVFAYPNPCYGDTVSFYFYVTKDSDATIEIYDLKGRLLGKRSGRANGSDPNNHLDWNAADIAPGVYIFAVRATADDGATGTVQKKFAILR